MKLLALLALFIAIPANADSLLKYGVGVAGSAKDTFAEAKILSIAYQDKLFGPMMFQAEGGFWTDSRADQGRKGSGFADTGIVFNVDTDGGLFAQSGFGLAVITDTDSMLGGHFQFNNDFALGLKDRSGNAIRLNYKHLSSAGIFNPNLGRDFLMIGLSVPL